MNMIFCLEFCCLLLFASILEWFSDDCWECYKIEIVLCQVSESITKQEGIIAEVQDLYQPFIQERGGSGGAREDVLKSIASVRNKYPE